MSEDAGLVAQLLTLDDVEFRGKTVILRVDINSPVDPETKRILDDTRIVRCLPTVRELAEGGAKVVMLAHQASSLEYDNYTELEQHAQILADRLGRAVKYTDDLAGPTAREMVRSLEPGEILLLNNVRIHLEEDPLFSDKLKLSPAQQAKTVLVRKLAPLADLYVCDAFAAVHRSEPSLVGFPEILPAAAGRLFVEELSEIESVMRAPARPALFVLGGAKIDDAFKMMSNVLESGSADQVLTVGLTGQIFLLAAGYRLGEASESLIRSRKLDVFVEPARKLLITYGERILYPLDVATVENGERREFLREDLPVQSGIVDIGHATVEALQAVIRTAGSIFMNGPAGVYERAGSDYGTREVWTAVAECHARSIIGGGDTILAAKRFGLIDRYSYVCTAGGGLVRILSGEKVPVVEALRRAAARGGA